MPTDGSGAQSNLPDPATLELVDEMIVESPDGRWQAIARHTEPTMLNEMEQFYGSLQVTDGQTTWEPVAEWRNYGLGYSFPAVYRWSPDSRYLYFTNLVLPDGCTLHASGEGLYRLDVASGAVTEILPSSKTLNFSLSPDESTVAYTFHNGQQTVFVARDVNRGVESSVSISETDGSARATEIVWSADGKTAVVALVHDACLPDQSSSIIRVGVPAMEATSLVDQDSRQFSIAGWSNSAGKVIRLADKDGNIWLLDAVTGKLAQES
jgi:hypothetical protein